MVARRLSALHHPAIYVQHQTQVDRLCLIVIHPYASRLCSVLGVRDLLWAAFVISPPPSFSCAACSIPTLNRSFTGWVRIQLVDVIKTRRISILMGAKMQLIEVVTGHSQFLSDFSIPQAIPTQPVNG